MSQLAAVAAVWARPAPTAVNLTYMVGLLAGAALFGWLSDRAGRVPALALGAPL